MALSVTIKTKDCLWADTHISDLEITNIKSIICSTTGMNGLRSTNKNMEQKQASKYIEQFIA